MIDSLCTQQTTLFYETTLMTQTGRHSTKASARVLKVLRRRSGLLCTINTKEWSSFGKKWGIIKIKVVPWHHAIHWSFLVPKPLFDPEATHSCGVSNSNKVIVWPGTSLCSHFEFLCSRLPSLCGVLCLFQWHSAGAAAELQYSYWRWREVAVWRKEDQWKQVLDWIWLADTQY